MNRDPIVLKAGCAKIEISPDQPLRGRHDVLIVVEPEKPIFAHALALQTDSRPLLLISCDLVGFFAEFAGELEARVAAALGIPAQRVVLWGTHSHSCPCTNRQVEAFGRRENLGTSNQSWYETLAARLCDAATQAVSRLEPVTIAGGRGAVDGIASNRIIQMPDGSVRMRAGELCEAPDGAIDPDVRSLFFRRRDGTAMAILMNYASHPTSLDGGYTYHVNPDYPGYAVDRIAAELGEDVCCLFGMGAAGNINCRKYATLTNGRNLDEAACLGGILGDEVVRQFHAVTTGLDIDDMELTVDHATFPGDDKLVPKLDSAVVELDAATAAYRKAMSATAGDELSTATQSLFKAMWQVSHAQAVDGDGRIPVALRRLRLGDEVCVLFAAGEYFVEIGKEIFARSDFPLTYFVTAVHLDPLYVPDHTSFATLIGRGDAYGVDRMRRINRLGCTELADWLVAAASANRLTQQKTTEPTGVA